MKVKNKFGEFTSGGWIDILSKPEIVGLKDQNSIPFETVCFDAIVYANPKPKVSWTRANENLSNNDNCQVIADVESEKYRLVFQSVGPTEGGTYTLTAINSQGTTAVNFKLNVHGTEYYVAFKINR